MQSLIDDIINAVNELVYQGIGSLESGLFATPPERLGFKPATAVDGGSELEYPDAKQEIEEGLHKLETLLEFTVDKNFDKFEIYVLRSILSVPEELATWVRLSHYNNLTYPIPTNAPSPEAVQLLRHKVAASRTVSQALASEQARNKAMLEQLRSMTSSVAEAQAKASTSFAFLADAPSASTFNISANGQQPLTTNANFALSQLPALRAILAELRPKLTELQTAGLGHSGAREEMETERKAYIDHRTMKHAVRNGHASAGTAGLSASRDIDEGEVQAIEKVANMFGPS